MSKELAKKIQSVLKELGHEIPLGHSYELLSKLNGFNSWNVAAAKGSKLTLAPASKESAADFDRFLDTSRKQAHIGPVDTTAYLCSLTASATVEITQTVYAKSEEDARRFFLENVVSNKNLEVSLVEPPVAPHDFEYDDIHAEVDKDVDTSRLIRTYNGISKKVPGACAFIGAGKDVYEAKIVTQAAEAKIYVEVRANSEEEAQLLVKEWMDKEDLTSPPYDQIVVKDHERVPVLKDWEVICIDSVEVQHVQKV